jgi:hypothetical protein
VEVSNGRRGGGGSGGRGGGRGGGMLVYSRVGACIFKGVYMNRGATILNTPSHTIPRSQEDMEAIAVMTVEEDMGVDATTAMDAALLAAGPRLAATAGLSRHVPDVIAVGRVAAVVDARRAPVRR